MALFDDELRKAQQQRAMYNAQLRANQAQSRYETAQANIPQKNDDGGLVGALKNAWNGLTSGATSLWNATAGGVNEIAGGIQSAAHSQNTKNTMADASNRRNEIAKKYGYASYSDAMNDDNASQDFWNEIKGVNSDTMGKLNKSKEEYVNSDTYKNLANMSQNKYGADAIRGWNFLGDVLTAGTGATAANVAFNSGQGFLGGIADQLEETPDGTQFNWDEALKRGTSSAAGGAVAGIVGGKLGNMGGKSNLGKILGSNVGRGMATGAASSAVTAGTQTALEGGDLGQVLASAADAGKRGALTGGITASAMGLANKGFNKVSDAINKETTPNVARTVVEAETKPITTDATDTDAKATGWGNKDMEGSVKKKNLLQKTGQTLRDTGQQTKDATVYGKLKGNLADEMASKNSVERLRQIGFGPSDYEQAANLSEVANKWYDDQVKASKVRLDMPDTYKLADDAAYYRNLSADQADKLKMDITKRLDAVRKTGGGLSTFDAAGLEKVAKGLGQDAERMTTTNYGGSKKRISNLSADAEAYANALNDIKDRLRSKVDDMTDYNPDSLRKVLKNAGATDQQVDYLTDAKSMAAVKRNTSLLEDARNMYRQIKSSPMKRGANADNSTSITTQLANASGAGQLLNTMLRPVALTVGNVEKGVGNVLSGIGDRIAGNGGNVLPSNLSNLANKAVDSFANSAVNTTNVANSPAGNAVNAITSGVQRGAIRQNALNEAEKALENKAYTDALNNAQAEAEAARVDYENSIAQASPAYQAQQSYAQPQTTTIAPTSSLDRISQAMNMALAAGDITAYGQLADLYTKAYKIYEMQNPTANTTAKDLTANQSKALTGLQQLQTLSQMQPGVGTALANSPIGGVVNMFGGDEYANQAQSLALTLGYLQSGANITPREAENIGKSYIPSAYDSENVRQQKLSRAEQLLRNYLADTSSLATQ